MHESSTHRIFQTFKSRDTCDTNDCLLLIDNRGCLIRCVHPIWWTRHNVVPMRYSLLACSIELHAPLNHAPFAPYWCVAQDFQLGYWQAYLSLLILNKVASCTIISDAVSNFIVSLWDMLRYVFEKGHWLTRKLSSVRLKLQDLQIHLFDLFVRHVDYSWQCKITRFVFLIRVWWSYWVLEQYHI